MEQYEGVSKTPFAPAILSKDGKPLLSWRVAILPMIEQKELYGKFHLDEPWDSANNKPLVAQMPAIFHTNPAAPISDGKTQFVIPIGKGAAFESETSTQITSDAAR